MSLIIGRGADPMETDSLSISGWVELSSAEKIEASIDRSILLAATDPEQALAYARLAVQLASVSRLPESAYRATTHQAYLILERFHDRPQAIERFHHGLSILAQDPKSAESQIERYMVLWLGLGQAYDGINLDSMERYAQLAFEAIGQYEISQYVQYDAYTLMGNVYLQHGPLELNQAIQCYQEAYMLTTRAGLDDLSSIAASNLGVTYLEDKRYQEALTYFKIVLQSLDPLDPLALAINTHYNMAKTYQGMGEARTALTYFEQAEALAQQDKDVDAQVDILIQRSLILIGEADLQPAQEALQQASKLLPLAESEIRKGELDLAWGDWFLQKEDHVNAYMRYLSALSLLDDLAPNLKLQALGGLAKATAKLGNMQESNRYWSLYAQVVDSIYAREKTQQIAAMQARFETLQARDETRRLQEIQTKDQRIIGLQRWLLVSFIGLGGFLIIFSYRLYLANVQKAEMNKRLAQLNQDKDMLMRVVAHDLKAPLANIKGLTEFLTHTSQLPKDQQQVIGMISTEANRSEDLARNLLDLDTLEHGSVQLNIQRTDATDVVKTLRFRYEKAASKKQQQIMLEGIEQEIPIYTDLSYLYRILDNLLSNAVKYAPVASLIRMTIRGDRDRVQFRVIDQGPGLSEADKAKIFQKFAKLSARPTGGESSTGLGLAIAKSLSEKLGGVLMVESTLGEGASFILDIPTHATHKVS